MKDTKVKLWMFCLLWPCPGKERQQRAASQLKTSRFCFVVFLRLSFFSNSRGFFNSKTKTIRTTLRNNNYLDNLKTQELPEKSNNYLKTQKLKSSKTTSSLQSVFGSHLFLPHDIHFLTKQLASSQERRRTRRSRSRRRRRRSSS